MGYSGVPFGHQAFRWIEDGGMVSLGNLNEGDYSVAYGVSADGLVVVGEANDENFGSDRYAFRWTSAGGMVSLGVLNGGTYSKAYATNADGSVVVGEAGDGDSDNETRAFRWTEGGMLSLGTFNGGSSSIAYGVSADGSVVVGGAKDGDADDRMNAFRWTESDGLVSLGALSSYPEGTSMARGVSADGSVVVGYADDAEWTQVAFRWTEDDGMVSLGKLSSDPSASSRAYGVSGDGAVVVGAADYNWNLRGFRWTQSAGMQSIEDWLRDAGVSVPVDITSSAEATSEDGSVVVGRLESGTAFIARVSSAGSGLVTPEDVRRSLVGTAQAGGDALSAGNTLIHGAHGRPLMRRVAEGKSTFWVAGDWGRDDHGARSGSLGLAEVGLGRNFGPAQVNVSLGRTWSRQAPSSGGRIHTDGTYVLAEAMMPLAGKLWAIIGGYGQWGDASIRRDYLNAGVQTASKGTPDLNTWGVRARLEWDRLYQLAGADFSPYADLSYAESRLDAYTERGGGFPARFDSRREASTELHIGVNMAKPLRNGMTLTGTLEGTHRFEKRAADTSGEVIGLFDFDLRGQKIRQNWLRAGAGIEGRLGDGMASVALNVTTHGTAPSAWLAFNWQRTF